jgi:hypothetical protein
MDEPVPSTKPPTALDRVNARRVIQHIKEMLAPEVDARVPAEYGTRLAEMFVGKPNDDVIRKAIVEATEGYLASIKERKVVNDYGLGNIRRKLWRDCYPNKEDRRIAVLAYWRARKTKEVFHWAEGESLTQEQWDEFSHLVNVEFYGVNDWCTGYAYLPRPSGYVMDIYVRPIQPINYITVSMVITPEGAQVHE